MRFAGTEEQKPILGIPLVVGPPVVRVQPQPVVVPIYVEDVRVAVGVVMCEVPSVSPLIEGLCRSQSCMAGVAKYSGS